MQSINFSGTLEETVVWLADQLSETNKRVSDLEVELSAHQAILMSLKLAILTSGSVSIEHWNEIFTDMASNIENNASGNVPEGDIEKVSKVAAEIRSMAHFDDTPYFSVIEGGKTD
ncbi:hypothetical protein JS562_37415 [Agrobacterium sp. S2]|nr:hypothetical protein [Agrobacterium sp. S2]